MSTPSILPITHEFAGYLKYSDELKIYHALIALANKRGKEFDVDDVHVKSRPGGQYTPGTDDLAFEYDISYGKKTGASKFSLHISPLFGPGTRTKFGKTISRTFVGTQIGVQCSYYGLDEVYATISTILHILNINTRYLDTLYYDESTITQFARHVRYHEMHEHDVDAIITSIRTISESTGNSKWKQTGEMVNGKTYFNEVRVDRLDAMGFLDFEWVHGAKTYRIKAFTNRLSDDPLYHPKLEVMLNTKDSNEKILITDYDKIQDELDELLLNIISWAGVTTFIPDDYFEIHYVPLKYEIKDNLLTDIADMDINRADVLTTQLRNNEMIFFRVLCSGITSPREIAQKAGISIDTVYNYCKRFGAKGVLRHKYGSVSFVSNAMQEQVTKSLKVLDFMLDKPLVLPERIKTAIDNPDHPDYFVNKYSPKQVQGWKYRFVIHDPVGAFENDVMLREYRYHIKHHKKLFGLDLPKKIKYPSHYISIQTHHQPDEIKKPHFVTSHREKSTVIKENRAKGIFEDVVVVPHLMQEDWGMDFTQDPGEDEDQDHNQEHNQDQG